MAGPATRRLAELAKHAGAKRAPFYVRRPIPPGLQQTYQAEGWYWLPPSHEFAVFLGYNEIVASVRLIHIIEENTAHA